MEYQFNKIEVDDLVRRLLLRITNSVLVDIDADKTAFVNMLMNAKQKEGALYVEALAGKSESTNPLTIPDQFYTPIHGCYLRSETPHHSNFFSIELVGLIRTTQATQSKRPFVASVLEGITEWLGPDHERYIRLLRRDYLRLNDLERSPCGYALLGKTTRILSNSNGDPMSTQLCLGLLTQDLTDRLNDLEARFDKTISLSNVLRYF